MKNLLPLLALLAFLGYLASPRGAGQGEATPALELVGWALLPADTFAPGPPSGAYRETPGFRSPSPAFAGQPVQGFSAIQRGPVAGTYWVLSDNGFGSKANSPDYLLRLYLVRPEPKTAQGGEGGVEVLRHVQLRDPLRKVPFPILNEGTRERLLTGYDFDPESFVIGPDGSLWVGDEFGPYLLRFGPDGVLLDPPYPTPDFGQGKDPAKDQVRAPQNPALLLNPPAPGQAYPANLATSRGFEGMAINPGKTRIYPMLEGAVAGDPPGTLRIYEFDPAARRYLGLAGLYRLEDPAHAIGDIVAVNEEEYLVIERDSRQGDEARFKRVYLVNLKRKDAQGFVSKELLVDLLNLRDPRGLAPFSRGGAYRFPYFTIEAVLPLDGETLLLVNDNNYPATGGRGAGVKDPNEFIWIRLAKPLNLDPALKR
ncbi:esterase-like activity of phytase family protein [Thermus sp.]|uniref:esterase-like activity of phytase family protein n=1 Tax=Thermus sp. TaxID=275 RepID=UPI002624DC00|nr:esterase-like activity of phytase family protein [Thermus sp.]MCX7850817.1 esterase-like activity of phytase family protein [Thermus sp.]